MKSFLTFMGDRGGEKNAHAAVSAQIFLSSAGEFDAFVELVTQSHGYIGHVARRLTAIPSLGVPGDVALLIRGYRARRVALADSRDSLGAAMSRFLNGVKLMEFLFNKPWLSEIGLILDMFAFWILSWDLIRSVRGERIARDEIQKLERKAFNARYGVFAPSQEVVQQQQEDFEARQAKRLSASEADINSRQRWAWLAIILAGVGFVLQIWGGWPST